MKIPPVLKGKIIGLDTETTGLDPYHGDRIFCWSYFTDKGEYGFMYKNPANLKWLDRLLNDPTKEVVLQKAKFDLKMLLFEDIDVLNLKAKIHCTLIMSKVLNSVQVHHDLSYLAREHLHRFSSDKEDIEKWIKANTRNFNKLHNRKPTFKDAPIHLVKRRVLWDAETTYYLFQVLYPKVQEICPELYETERKLMFVCIDMENTGVLIDITKAKELRAKAQISVKRTQKELNELVCPLTVRYKRKGKLVEKVVEEFNPNSSTRHLPAAFRKLNIQLKYKTKPKKGKKGRGKTGGGNWCFDEYALVRYVSKPLALVIHTSGKENWSAVKFLREVHRVVVEHNLNKRELLSPLILKYREQSKLIATYYDHLINDCVDVKITPTGREIGVLHCKFNQSEAMTGRFSSSGLNLQNMPRLLGPRECFIVRKGRKNWYFDYEQVEMRFYVHFSKDKKMAANLATDLHRHTASEIYKKPLEDITKEERERAGSINFAVIYGVGAATMAETLSRKGAPTTESEALQFIEKYRSIYPSVQRTTNVLKNQLKRKGYVTNPFGRRYYIPIKLGYKALDYMCQGTSADQLKKAMVDIWYWLRKEELKTKLIKTIHDELGFEIPHSEEKKVVSKIIETMQDLTSYFVPITVGVDIAPKRWSQKIKPADIGFKLAA